MFITTHAVVGIAIGQTTSQPFWAFIFGLTFHFLLDIIPHGDEILMNTSQQRSKKNEFYWAAAIDFTFMILVLSILSTKMNVFTPSIIAAILGSIIPDFISGFYDLISDFFGKSKNFLPRLILNQARPLFTQYNRFHFWVHKIIMIMIPLNLAISYQIVFLGLFLYLKL